MENVGPSSALVEVERPEEDPAIQLYKATVKNGSPHQSCTIMACIPPLKCQINNLTSGTTYVVAVKACVPGENVCSTSTEQTVVITPKGEPCSIFYVKRFHGINLQAVITLLIF